MSWHNILNEIKDHSTGSWVGGVWKLFKYSKPFSCHNCAKYLGDDHTNCCHASIGLDQTCKWWPTRQFTYLIGIAEVNAMNLQALSHKEPPEPQLNFCQVLADKMIINSLDNSRNIIKHVTMPMLQKRGKGDGRVLTTWYHYRGSWDNLKKNISKAEISKSALQYLQC